MPPLLRASEYTLVSGWGGNLGIQGQSENLSSLIKTIKSFSKNMFLIPDQCQPDDLLHPSLKIIFE